MWYHHFFLLSCFPGAVFAGEHEHLAQEWNFIRAVDWLTAYNHSASIFLKVYGTCDNVGLLREMVKTALTGEWMICELRIPSKQSGFNISYVTPQRFNRYNFLTYHPSKLLKKSRDSIRVLRKVFYNYT